MSHLFSDCLSLMTVNLPKCKSNNLTNTSYMFYKCKSLKFIDLSNFKTNITDMIYLFCYCESLKSIDISSFNTAK